MLNNITPEKAGVSPANIERYLRTLKKRGASMHSVLMMRWGEVFFEHYYPPFTSDFCHRMYSQTKSFVGIAIGLLQDEGKLSVNDRIIDYFPEKIDTPPSEYLKKLTIKDMLTMRTAGGSHYWFDSEDKDRTHLYLNESKPDPHRSGTSWSYDSAGSQVLSSLVEKLSGKPLLDYMKEKLFDKMDCFKTAEMLKTRNGDTWGDSAMLCTTRDIATFALLLMNGGVFEGERLISESYVKEAISAVADNHEDAHGQCFRHGYGYQIWRTEQNGFAFVGMGDQLTICLPDRGFIFSCTADNQFSAVARNLIVYSLFDMIVDEMKDEQIPYDSAAHKSLADFCSTLELRWVEGIGDSPFREKLSGAEFICAENPMGIERFTIEFSSPDRGELRYVCPRGEKVIPFGVGCNVFSRFPEEGYSTDVGGEASTDGYTYRDAASAAWLEEEKLMIYVQLIDRYFGNLCMIFSHNDGEITATFVKAAEDFLKGYQGILTARRQDQG